MPTNIPLRLLSCALMATIVIACKERHPAPRILDQSAYKQFAEQLKYVVDKDLLHAVNKMVDPVAMLERSLDGETIDESLRISIESAIANDVGMAGLLRDPVGDGGRFQPLELRMEGEWPVILCRMTTSEGALNYLDLYLSAPADKPAIADVYFYRTGESLSGVLRRMVLEKDADFTVELARKIKGDTLDLAKAVGEFDRLIDEGKPQEAIGYYHELPRRLRKDRVLMIRWMTAAFELGVAEFDKVYAVVHRAFPGEPCLDLWAYDRAVAGGNSDSMLVAIARLDKRVKSDPFLAYVRALVYEQKGMSDSIRYWARRASRAEPMMKEPYQLLIALDTEERRFDDAVETLERMHSYIRMEASIDDLVNQLTPFTLETLLASDEYRQWRHRFDSVAAADNPLSDAPRVETIEFSTTSPARIGSARR